MRLKLVFSIIGSLLLLSTLSAASSSQLTEVGLQSKDNATTLTIRATGAFTHTEYRPTENLLLVDLAGVSAAKMENKSRELHGQFPGVESYHVVGYRGASGAETTRVELTLASNAVVNVVDARNAVSVHVLAGLPALTQAAAKPVSEPVAASKIPFTPAKTENSAFRASARTVRVQKVSVFRGKDGMNIEISASGAMQPKAMKLTAPDRIVIDIPNALPTSVKRQIAVNSNEVKAIRVSHYQVSPPATRIVIDMASAQEFELSSSGVHSILKLHGMTVAASAPAVKVSVPDTKIASAPASPAASARLEAKNTVIVEPVYTVRPATAADIAPEENKAQKPSPVSRAAEAASHFAVPMPEIPLSNANASMKPRQPSMTPAMLQAASLQAPAATQQSVGCNSGRYNGEPISVNLKEVDLRDFFRLIHDISGLNVVLDPLVKGSLTIVLDDVPWDQALSIVLKNNGLDCQLEGNVLRIATTSTIKKEADDRRLQVEAQSLAVELTTVNRYLSYAVASEVVVTLKSFLSSRGSVIPDNRTNSLIISDIPNVIPNVDRLIKQLDTKTPEVEIEARVVAATRNFARDIGTQLGFGFKNGPTEVTGAGGGFSNLVGGLTGLVGAGTIPFFSNLGAGANTSSGIGVATSAGNYRLDFILTLGESRGLLKILSRPRVVTQNNISAVIRQGQSIPVVTAAQLGGPPTVSYVQAFLRLTVKPQITNEGTIFLNVDVENTTPDFSRVTSNQPNPLLLTQQATTQVLVTDGGTVVIGGVIQTQNNIAITQVPLLGNIPVFGNLFKKRAVQTSTQELIFFITPKIVQT